MSGTLYLIPAPLGDVPLDICLPPAVLTIANRLQHWVVEQPKTARAILKRYDSARPISSLVMAELNEHTPETALPDLLAPLLAGHDVGLLSEAGCPGVADPGAGLVRLAHQKGIRVVPLVGPSSILLAVMAAGASGQRFRFHGYLPVESVARATRLQALERDSARGDEAQLFIETPYRNDALLETILHSGQPGTRLTVCRDLTLADELIVSATIAEWRGRPRPDLKRRPTIFVLHAGK